MKLLIDGDVVRYRCGFAAQKTRYTVDMDDQSVLIRPYAFIQLPVNFENAKDANAFMKEHAAVAEEYNITLVRTSFPEVEPVENALHSVKLMMQAMQDKWPEAEMVVYFSCKTSDNWRTELYPQYKANRPDRRPEHDEAIRKYMYKQYAVKSGAAQGLEADDLIAMAATECRAAEQPYVICSIDKDLKQISGPFYDFTKDTLEDIPMEIASGMLELQKITGDNVDNIPGIAGWGPKKAAAFMANPASTAWDAYQSVFEDVDVAWYHYCLNTALVTLPGSEEELRWLISEVENARKEVEAIQDAGDSDGRGPAGTGTGETNPPAVEASC